MTRWIIPLALALAGTACAPDPELLWSEAQPLRINAPELTPRLQSDCRLRTDTPEPVVGDVVRMTVGDPGFVITPDREVTWCVGPGQECRWGLISEPGEPTAAVRLSEAGTWTIRAEAWWATDMDAEEPLCSIEAELEVAALPGDTG